MSQFRTGDTVFHEKLQEKWLVAWADERSVVPCGWPETIARAEDCRLVEAAADSLHRKLVEEIATRSSRDLRTTRCFSLMEAWRSAECAAMMHL
jgi:hypothetical protein